MNISKNTHCDILKCPHCGSTTFINRCFALVDETVYIVDRPGWTTPSMCNTKDRPEIKCTLDIASKDVCADLKPYELIGEGYDLTSIRCANCNDGKWKSIEQLKEEQK